MNKKTKKITFAMLLALSLLGTGLSSDASASGNTIMGRDSSGSLLKLDSGIYTSEGLRIVGIEGVFETPEKQALVNRINEIRREAYNEGLVKKYVPIKWSNSLEQASLRRAAEASLSEGHKRLNGEQLYSRIYQDNFAHLAGNLAANSNLKESIESFYSEKKNLNKVGETGHYLHMIDSRWTTVAMSSFTKNNSSWAITSQLFGENNSDSDRLVGSYGKSIVYTGAKSQGLTNFRLKQNIMMEPNSKHELRLTAQTSTPRWISNIEPTVEVLTNRDWSSSNTSVATIDSNGNITAHKEGITKIKVTSGNQTYTTTVTVAVDRIKGYTIPGSWIKSSGKWWYKHYDGSYTTNGWEKIHGVWYHFDGAGWMQTGWIKTNGTWYYLDGSGAMKTGWIRDNGTWYYLDGSGAMQTGWIRYNGDWYYLDGSGAMKTGWIKVSGKWYYAYNSGALAINTMTPDGYYVNYNGEWIR